MKIVTIEGKWPGTVKLYDPQTLDQEAAWEYALAGFRKAIDNGGGAGAVHGALLPGIFANVAEWNLEGFPKDVTRETFPTRPRKSRDFLIKTLVDAITEIYKQDDPNE